MSNVDKQLGPEWLLKPWEKVDSLMGTFYVRKNLHDDVAIIVQCVLMPLTMKKLKGFSILSDKEEEEYCTEDLLPDPKFTWMLIEMPYKIKAKLYRVNVPREFDSAEAAIKDADRRMIKAGFTLLTEQQTNLI